MAYYFSKIVDAPFEQAVDRTTAVLGDHGFGVLTKIDVRSTLKEKIGAEFRPYIILGACNPKMAYAALEAEDKIGTMLPCNVIVQDVGGKIEVTVVDPVASMQAVDNQGLSDIAEKVSDLLKAVIQEL